ncbi:response regulator [Hymenobacter sp. BT559]|uniref:response regulator n=1 Tax=Hymenobacter sp. BT559 TaxID=2795729 RepID=UPI0018EDE652|nr:response regulator [Hymenobacter sp. BT559]
MADTDATILLVDDDEPTRLTMRRWLTQLNVQVHILEAEDGEQALASVKAHCQATTHPRSLLVLLDLNMPVMDGLTFLEHKAHLPRAYQEAMTVVVMSSSPSEAELEKARSLATEIKRKPLDVHQLLKLIRDYLPDAAVA